MPQNQKLTDKPLIASFSNDALVHIVEPNDPTQGVNGSDYKMLAKDFQAQAGQDNIDIRKHIKIDLDDTIDDILVKINNMSTYTVSEKQSVWFVSSLSSVIVPNSRILKFKMMNKGKGTYGVGGTQLSILDIELMYDNTATILDIENDPTTDKLEYGDLTGQSISEWLNSQDPAKVIQSQEDGYTIFKGSVDGVETTYLWIGEPGVYGVGETMSTMADFEVLSDEIKIEETYGWATPQQYGAVGDGITDDTLAVKNCLDNNARVLLYGIYKVDSSQLNIKSGDYIFSNNATLLNDSTSGNILTANGVNNWNIGGVLKFVGAGNTSGTQRGLYIFNCQNFKANDLNFIDIAGNPIELDDTVPSGRGYRGLISNLSANNNYGSVQFSNRAEYHTIQNVNIQGSSTVGLKILAGNVSIIGGSVVDNANGVFVGGGGANNSHGILANLNFNHNDLTGGYNARFEGVGEGHTVIGCHFYGNSVRNIEITSDSEAVSFVGGIIDGRIDVAGTSTHLISSCQINPATTLGGGSTSVICVANFNKEGGWWEGNTPDPKTIQTTTDQTKTGMLTLIGGGPGTFNITRNGFGTLFANSSTEHGYLAYDYSGTNLFYRVFGNGNFTIGQAAGVDTGERLQVNGNVKINTGNVTIVNGVLDAELGITTAGNVDGATASFEDVTITNAPTSGTSGTNKAYVDGRGMVNLTNVPFTLATINALYPNAQNGDRIVCPKINTGTIYTKADVDWVVTSGVLLT